jgi:hypothetical protein
MSKKTQALLGLMLTCLCPAAPAADPYFTGNPYSPYPPGCVTLPAKQIDLYGDNLALFWSGSLWLEVVHKVQSQEEFKNLGLVNVGMYRVGCAEPGRSAILVGFSLPAEWVDPRNTELVLPTFGSSFNLPMHTVPFELKAEPNGWGQSIRQQALTMQAFGDFTGGWLDARWFSWFYWLDVGPAGAAWPADLLTEYYNGKMQLELHTSTGWSVPVINVPATPGANSQNPALPLNGRLTGTWVEAGAADQGFLLTFSNPVPPAGTAVAEPENAELLVFLTWFTFGSRGEMLWLAGEARFWQGSTEVTLPILRITQGQFLGSQAAERTVVGQVRLKASQCNELEVDYDLSSLELGAGDLRLQRLEALEIAGYPCRDYQARLDSLSPQPGN